MNSEFSKEIHKRVYKNFDRRHIIAYGNDDLWGADLADVSRLANFNNKTTFLLTIIDIYSRYAWVIPLKNKTSISVFKAFKELGIYPKNLWIDQGKEFLNNDLMNLFKKHDVNMYYTYSGSKSVYVERFNRTIKEKLFNYMSSKNTKKYIDYLPEAVKEYNHTIHSSIKTTPYQVYEKDEIPHHKITYTANKPKLKIKDIVRISLTKGIFGKAYEAGWSTELFRIKSIDYDYPITYTIEDLQGEEITGQFYEKELQLSKFKENVKILNKDVKIPTKTINKKKFYYVTYKGLDKKFDEWVDEKTYTKLKLN